MVRFHDVGWENLALAEAEDRRARDHVVQAQATATLGQRVATLSGYYPQASPGLLTGLAIAGLDPDDPRVYEATRRELALNVAQAGPATPGNPILRGLKNVSATTLLIMDSLEKEVIKGTTSFLAGLTQGMGVEESARRSYGFSGGALALSALTQDRPVTLGSGWSYGSAGTDLSPETIAALERGVPFEEAIRNPTQQALGLPVVGYGEALRQSQGAKVPGTDFPVTLGRLVASAVGFQPVYGVNEPGKDAYSWMSGAVDFASQIFLDPSNIAFGWVGDLRKLSNVIIPDGVRPTVLGQSFLSWLGSGHGRRVTEELAKITDFDQMHRILTRSSRSAPNSRLVTALIDANTPEAVADVLRRASQTRLDELMHAPVRTLMPHTWTARA